MKYTIISINDDRKEYKDAIRAGMKFDELNMQAYNANERNALDGIAARGLDLKPIWGNPKRGELGVWLSNYDRWHMVSRMTTPLVVFEDDAIVDSEFDSKLESLMSELPDDWDFVALWVPENQRQDYYYDVVYNEYGDPRINGRRPAEYSYYKVEGAEKAALVYQGYGMVSLMYSPRGGKKLVELAKSRGIDNPVDCWIYQEAHKGNLNGYAPMPEHASIVHYDWAAASHVQQTERVS